MEYPCFNPLGTLCSHAYNTYIYTPLDFQVMTSSILTTSCVWRTTVSKIYDEDSELTTSPHPRFMDAVGAYVSASVRIQPAGISATTPGNPCKVTCNSIRIFLICTRRTLLQPHQ